MVLREVCPGAGEQFTTLMTGAGDMRSVSPPRPYHLSILLTRRASRAASVIKMQPLRGNYAGSFMRNVGGLSRMERSRGLCRTG